MPDNDMIVELTGVTRCYPAPAGSRSAPVLQDVSLRVSATESLAIVGPSGSGKSTLLHLIGGLDRADSGSIKVAGRDLAGLNDDELARVRNRQIGFVFQFHYLLPQCTVLENVLVPALATKLPAADRSQILERARRLLARVGLGDRLAHRPDQLSGGERQRVAVVRALINQPPLVLADEPTGALDAQSARDLADLLVEINHSDKVTLIVVTHSAELAGRMSRVLELRQGSLQPVRRA
jgi:ABC-type lipoprotein export system ATPase subunit